MKDTEVLLNTGGTGQQGGDSSSDAVISRNATVRIDVGSTIRHKKKYKSLADGSILDEQYTIVKKIGDGGMGVVYLAQDNKLGRFVAVKRLNKSSMSHPSIKKRFFQEAKTVAALTHVHIVHVYALDEDEQGPYIVMEYIPGPQERSPDSVPPEPFSLVDIVQNDGPMSVSDALNTMIKICKAIDYAHRNGVIHRDLKPSNVLIDESYEPKIVDFGLARKSSASDGKLTVPGEKMLSIGYGAPEQEADAGSSDERADIYGLGGLTYFCVTGQNPRYFRETDVPKELQKPIAKALETNRDKRWNSVKEYIEALKKIQTPSEIEVPTVKTTWRCKWCDTVNPVAVQFCEDCGWDGITPCLECGAKLHVGIQYCGECGADAREYENANRLLTKLNRRRDSKDFAYVAKHAERTASFRPVGPNGRKTVEETIGLREQAEKTLERISTLKEIIPLEMSSGNYERARQFINEYRTVTDNYDFSAEMQEIPTLIAKRDLKRATNALKRGDWKFASRLCSDIMDTSSAFNEEANRIIISVRRHRTLKKIRNSSIITLGVLLVYVLSAAPAYRTVNDTENKNFSTFFDFEMMLHNSTFLEQPLDKYAELWGVKNMYRDRSVQNTRETGSTTPTTTQMSDKIAPMRSSHDMAMLRIEADFSRKKENWPREYVKALEDLQQKMQNDGNYDGWNAVRDQLYYFEVYQDIDSVSTTTTTGTEDTELKELAELKSRFKNMLANYNSERSQAVLSESNKYIELLTNMQKDLTREGKMDEASAVNGEIKRIKNSVTINEAAESIARKKQAEKTTKTSGSLVPKP